MTENIENTSWQKRWGDFLERRRESQKKARTDFIQERVYKILEAIDDLRVTMSINTQKRQAARGFRKT